MLRRVREWIFGQEYTPPPAMVRVLDDRGYPVSSVEINAEYFPSGYTLIERRITAQGLCLLGWPRLQQSVRIRVSSGNRNAEVQLDTDRCGSGRVVELRLTA